MAFYIRKAFNFGPLRLNFSKSGLGISFGMKGLRVGCGPKGNYVHAGRKGLYYKKNIEQVGNEKEWLTIKWPYLIVIFVIVYGFYLYTRQDATMESIIKEIAQLVSGN